MSSQVAAWKVSDVGHAFNVPTQLGQLRTWMTSAAACLRCRVALFAACVKRAASAAASRTAISSASASCRALASCQGTKRASGALLHAIS